MRERLPGSWTLGGGRMRWVGQQSLMPRVSAVTSGCGGGQLMAVLVGAVSLFAHHLRLLGANPANWVRNPIG